MSGGASRPPLALALLAAAAAAWAAGVVGIVAPVWLFFQVTTGGHTLYPYREGIALVVLIVGVPVSAVATPLIGLPAHLWLARRGLRRRVYLALGAGAGVVADLLALMAIAACIAVATQRTAYLLAMVTSLVPILAVPAALAGASAAWVIWAMRRPDIWRTP